MLPSLNEDNSTPHFEAIAASWGPAEFATSHRLTTGHWGQHKSLLDLLVPRKQLPAVSKGHYEKRLESAWDSMSVSSLHRGGSQERAFGEAPGIPVRHLETLQGGAVLNDRPWFLSPRSSVYSGTQQILGGSRESRLRSMHADMYIHTSQGPSYRQMAHGVGNQRMAEERLFTKMKGVILNWRHFCPLGYISNVYRHFWSHFSHPLGKVLLSSREQRPV